MGSVLCFQGGINVPAYTAAKHGLAGLTKALANEWAGQGINVNCLAPSYYTTDLTRALQDDPNRYNEIRRRTPAHRWGRPSDIAGAALLPGVAGLGLRERTVLPVDGGWLAF